MSIVFFKILLDQRIDRQTFLALELTDQMTVDVALVAVFIRRNVVEISGYFFYFIFRIILQKILQKSPVVSCLVLLNRRIAFLLSVRLVFGFHRFCRLLLDNDPGLGILVLLDRLVLLRSVRFRLVRFCVDSHNIDTVVLPVFDDMVKAGILRYNGEGGMLPCSDQISQIRRKIEIQGIPSRFTFDNEIQKEGSYYEQT